MMPFWLGAAAMLLVAVTLIALPWLLGKNARAGKSLSNKTIIRQRLEELQREENEALISAEERQEAEKELKLALLNEQQPQVSSQRALKPVYALALLPITLMAGGIYLKANEIASLQRWQQAMHKLPELGKRIVFDADPSIQPADIQDFALGIRSKLADDPSDPTGWLLLGRLYSSLNRLDSALQAFERSLALAPDHVGALSSYGQALVMTGQEQYLKEALTVLQTLLTITPEDTSAIGLMAVAATQLGETELAVKHWRLLQQQVPEGAPIRAEIRQQLAKLTGEEETSPATRLMVKVDISAPLKDKLPASGFLFVFAQDASGAVKMPAAVVKNPLSDLPAEVTLSDANAMMQGYSLSSLSEIRVVARVSMDENVAVAAGELEGDIVIQLQPGQQSSQTIIINKELM